MILICYQISTKERTVKGYGYGDDKKLTQKSIKDFVDFVANKEGVDTSKVIITSATKLDD